MPVPDKFDAAITAEAGARSKVGPRSLGPLKPNEVAIKILATAINPIDWKIRDYKFYFKDFPAVGGSDAAGEIVAVGEEVEGFKEGDRVFFQGILGNYDSSTFQQYSKMDYKLVAHTPKNISDEQAGGIALATVAALAGFYDPKVYGIKGPWTENGPQEGKGKGVIIIGGSSSVGQYAIQLARLSGFDKIIVNSSPKHVEKLKELGATTVLDRSTSTAKDYVEALGELPLGFIFDTISEPSTDNLSVEIAQSIKNVAEGRRIVARVNPGQIDEGAKKQAEKEPKVQLNDLFGASYEPRLRFMSEPAYKWLGGEDGVIARGLYVPNEPVIVDGGLEKLDEALDKNRAGVSGVKVVIRPFDK